MVVGILGGGQLARMLALAAHPLGARVVVLDPAPDACAGVVAEQLVGAYDDREQLARLAELADVVTYEFENVPQESAEFLAQRVPVHPTGIALAAAQDRLVEKSLFRELGIPVPDFYPVDSLESLQQAVSQMELPAVLKTRRMGYDGKGQAVLRPETELAEAWASIGEVPAIVEAFVPFSREVSVIAVRDLQGQVVTYPLSENTHNNGILHLSVCRPADPMQEQATDYARRLLEHLDYVGVLALELFQVGDELLANEFAPRVHNSGHWTIEGAETSQFENHMRAVMGHPLGSTAPVGFAAMVNCIGHMPAAGDVLAIPGAHLHDYGKEPREGRKVGHLTVRPQQQGALQPLIDKLERLVQS